MHKASIWDPGEIGRELAMAQLGLAGGTSSNESDKEQVKDY